MPKKPSSGISERLGQNGYLVANPQDEHFGCDGGSNRYRDSFGGKSSGALCDRHGFAGRHIGVAAWHRSIDANNSINRRHSGFAAECKGNAPTREEIAAASEPADQSQIEMPQPSAEALLKQFQAWAGEEEARAPVEPVQPAQDARAVGSVQPVQDDLCRMPRQRSGPCKSTDTSGAFKMREQTSGPSDILARRSGGNKMHEHRSRPYKIHEHRTSLCKMPRHRRSCKASVGAIRSSRK
jgi:hypothetical protein